jgi:hypothetical protein
MEVFCSPAAEDTNYKSNTSSEAVTRSTEDKDESDVSTLRAEPSVVTTALIVTGVLLVCALGGGLILVKLVKRLRKRPKTHEYCDVYAPRASYASIQSYAAVGSVSTYVSVQSDRDVDSDSRNATGYSYAAFQ